MRVFHGIGVNEDGRISDSTPITCFWEGVKYISDQIRGMQKDDIINQEEYENALGSVERFEKWDKFFNGSDRENRIPERTVNDLFGPAFNYVYSMDKKANGLLD